jgi:Tol biopolymer transport system component
MSDPVSRLNAALEGRYAIERELGEGGMARVYLADDLKHERKVALKVLKPELAAVVGAERFLAEIKTTANLQHPHVLPLFDSGEADGFLFYVMPYVEGESLRERLDREHQLPVDEAVKIATDLAEALDYAHRHKVIHRDIKPANILMHEGRPLIADFGIALAVGAAGGGRLTETGLSLGTPFYMSPEQATGDQFIGAATDTYALAAVLYEMLIGDPPYTGSTAQAVLGQIIAGERVSATEKRASVPANVDAGLRCALEKLPADRFKSAQDFAKALGDQHFRYGELTGAAATSGAGLWNRLSMAMTGLAAFFALFAVWLALSPEPPQPVTRFSFEAPNRTRLAKDLSFSPDGTRLAFTADGPGGQSQLWIRSLDAEMGEPIEGTEGATFPFWRPDGTSLAFFQQGSLVTLDLETMALLRITDAPNGRGGTWNEQDVILFAPTGYAPLYQITAGGEDRAQVTGLDEAEESHRFPNFLPDGRQFTFSIMTDAESDLAVGSLDEPLHAVVRADVSEGLPFLDYLLFVSQGTLMMQVFDGETANLVGDPTTLRSEVGHDQPIGNAQVAVSSNGMLAYRLGELPVSQLVWVDRDGQPLEPVGEPGEQGEVSLSPDGTRVAFTRRETGRAFIRTLDLAQGSYDQVVEGDRPAWLPDGSGLIFRRESQLYRRELGAASGTESVLVDNAPAGIGAHLSRDGMFLAYSLFDASGGDDIWIATSEGAEPRPLVSDPGNQNSPAISPTGEWIAYVSAESGQSEVLAISRSDERTTRVSIDGGVAPSWTESGQELLFVAPGDVVMSAPLDQSGFGTPERLFEATGEWVASLDGQRFLINQLVDTDPRFTIHVVLNFFEELRERVGN